MNESFKEICEYSLTVFLTMLYLDAIEEKGRLLSTTSTTNYHICGIYPETHKQILFLLISCILSSNTPTARPIFIRSCCASPFYFWHLFFRMQNTSRNVLSFLFFSTAVLYVLDIHSVINQIHFLQVSYKLLLFNKSHVSSVRVHAEVRMFYCPLFSPRKIWTPFTRLRKKQVILQ